MKNKNGISLIAKNKSAIVDSGGTTNYASIDIPYANQQVEINPITIDMPNSE